VLLRCAVLCRVANGPTGYIFSDSLLVNGSISVLQNAATGSMVDLLSQINKVDSDLLAQLAQVNSNLQAQINTLTSMLASGPLPTWFYTAGTSGTYTVPTNTLGQLPLYLHVRLVGAGGGGGGPSQDTADDNEYSSGGSGGSTVFGPYTGYGGAGGTPATYGTYGGAGGGVSIPSPRFDFNTFAWTGQSGQGGQWVDTANEDGDIQGGLGAVSYLGGQPSTSAWDSTNGPWFGGGGGGACASAQGNPDKVSSGGGGGAGGYVETFYYYPPATISWSVGAGGSAGADNAGGQFCSGLQGGSGAIWVTAYWH
jgi:hypothetical protein